VTLAALLLASALLAPPANVPVELYFVRHGQTVSNATGRYNAAGLNKLTATGEKQAQAVAKALAGIRFDAAFVSPSLRAEITAAPTLRQHRMVAFIAPEFNECCTEHGAARRRPASRRLPMDGPAKAPASLGGLVQVDPMNSRLYAPANYADGMLQVSVAAERTRALLRHVQKSQGVFRELIVGHSAQGARFLDLMLGRKPTPDIELKNGVIVVLRAEVGQPFRLVRKIENPYR